jgi:hypothetical protein
LLGIRLERIRPAHPEENGRHERMHRTLKDQTTKPPRTNLLQQQESFDDFIAEYNDERPHEALNQRCPTAVYRASKRPFPSPVPMPKYVGCDDVLKVSDSGSIHLPRLRQVYVSGALAGLPVGIETQSDGRWLVRFAALDLGYIDRAVLKLAPIV